MRIFKPSYSRPLPKGATKFTPRSGPLKGVRLCKFTDRRGHTKTERLTKDGKKILVETKLWHIQFEDHLGIKRELKAYTDHEASKQLSKNIQKLINYKTGNQPLNNELQEWLEQIPSAIRDELIRFGLVEAQQAEIGKPLSEHISDYLDHLSKRERHPRYIQEVNCCLNNIFNACSFKTWTDISAPRLKEYLDEKRDGGNGISKTRYNGILGAVKSFCR